MWRGEFRWGWLYRPTVRQPLILVIRELDLFPTSRSHEWARWHYQGLESIMLHHRIKRLCTG